VSLSGVRVQMSAYDYAVVSAYDGVGRWSRATPLRVAGHGDVGIRAVWKRRDAH